METCLHLRTFSGAWKGATKEQGLPPWAEVQGSEPMGRDQLQAPLSAGVLLPRQEQTTVLAV